MTYEIIHLSCFFFKSKKILFFFGKKNACKTVSVRFIPIATSTFHYEKGFPESRLFSEIKKAIRDNNNDENKQKKNSTRLKRGKKILPVKIKNKKKITVSRQRK